MKNVSRVMACLAAPFLAPSAFAFSELDLAVSTEVIAVDYRLRDEVRGSLWGVGAMFNDSASASLLSATFNVVGEATQTEDVNTGLGVKAVVHDTFRTAASLGIGGSVQYRPQELSGFGLEGQLYYAPEILSVNSEQYYEFVARVTYDVHPQARVFVGYTAVNVRYDRLDQDREVKIEDRPNLGFTLTF